MAGGEGDVPLTYDGAPGTDFLVTADGGADSIVGYTTGQIGRFEQLGEWTIMDVANSVGIYLDEGSFIKIKRQMCYLPPVEYKNIYLAIATEVRVLPPKYPTRLAMSVDMKIGKRGIMIQLDMPLEPRQDIIST